MPFRYSHKYLVSTRGPFLVKIALVLNIPDPGIVEEDSISVNIHYSICHMGFIVWFELAAIRIHSRGIEINSQIGINRTLTSNIESELSPNSCIIKLSWSWVEILIVVIRDREGIKRGHIVCRGNEEDTIISVVFERDLLSISLWGSVPNWINIAPRSSVNTIGAPRVSHLEKTRSGLIGVLDCMNTEQGVGMTSS